MVGMDNELADLCDTNSGIEARLGPRLARSSAAEFDAVV
jgi:hypothetical protein